MNTISRFAAARWAILLVLCFVRPSLAIDPPPPWILKAPTEQQRQYTKKIGAESERERAKVAKRRYEEKQEFRRAITAEMNHELALQQEIMLAQSKPSDESGAQGAGLGEIIGAGFSVRLWTFALLTGLVVMLYRFRDRFFQRGQNKP